MKGYLLDTHIFVWWWGNANKLSPNAYNAINNSGQKIYISSASIWEMSIKYHKGKFDEATLVMTHLDFLMKSSEFIHLPVTYQHGLLAGQFPQAHADPFDRMLVAQAMSENLILISKDSKLTEFDVNLLW